MIANTPVPAAQTIDDGKDQKLLAQEIKGPLRYHSQTVIVAPKIRIAVAGAGAFGKNHLRVLSQHPDVTLAGVYDTNADQAAASARDFSCPQFPSLAALSESADAAVVATPTSSHTPVALELLDAGLDVLIEKPIASTLDDARSIAGLAGERGRIVQVGHLERFNPAVEKLESLKLRPLFFEIHRLSVFTPRSLDIDVVLDLMIHDLEIVLALTGMMPEEIRAAGIHILSSRVDIANVRMQFPGGCIANFTASRASTEQVRKLRMFTPRGYLSADYKKQELYSIQVGENQSIDFRPIPIEKDEPLRREVAHFVECIRSRQAPRVGASEAIRALGVALDILDKIEVHAEIVAQSLGSR